MPPTVKQAPAGFSWKLPGSPDSKLYRELLGYVEGLKASGRPEDVKLGMAWLAAACEADFWLWQWKVMSLGRMKIKDPGHRRLGKLWVMEPWFFDRMREVQEIFERRYSPALIYWARYMLKSSAVQKGGILWFLAQDATTTHSVTTHREDKTGVRFGKDMMTEIQQNGTLRAHWPQFRDCPEFSVKQITVNRPMGIREPSFALFGIMASAASGHFTHQWYDDVVDPEERSPIVHEEIDSRLSMAAFTGSEDTLKVFIGVPSCDLDAVDKRRKKGTFFHPKAVSFHPGILPGGVYPFRSKRFYDKLRAETREDHFASQVLLQIVAPGSRYFREEWIRKYNQKPEEIARGCRIHILLDPAEGKKDINRKKRSDFLVIRVYAFGRDKRRRALDLWRERIGIVEATDLLFGPMPGEEASEENWWKVRHCGRRGLVGKWKEIDPDVTLWVENVGASQFDSTLRRDMRNRLKVDPASPTCYIRELRSNTPKEQRIANLQPDYRNGVLEYPAPGFGHGSYTTDDARDTYTQFVEDELKLWTLKGETLFDDMLDLEAWPSQPGVSMPYPDVSGDESAPPFLAQESALAEGVAESGPWASWRVA